MGLFDAPAHETLGAKLRRLANAAQGTDPYSRPAMANPPAWAASTAYTLGQMVVTTAGNIYVCVTPGTSTTVAPSSVKAGPTTDGTVGWMLYGPLLTGPTDPRTPTYSFTTTNPSGQSNSYLPGTAPQFFKFRGGYATANGTTVNLNRFNHASGSIAGSDCLVLFYTDAPKVTILAAATSMFRVRIDGQYYSQANIQYAASGNCFHTFDFTASGGPKPRLFEIDGRDQLSFYGVAVGGPYQVWAPPDLDVVKAVFIGNSLWEGSAYGPMCSSVPQIVGSKLGWKDCRNFSTGGTGWLNPGSLPYYTYGQRIPEALTLNPDIWVFGDPLNDGQYDGYTSAALSAAVVSALQAVRAGGSTAPIVVLGCWSLDNGSRSAAQITAAETAVFAGVTTFADPLNRTFTIPIQGASPVPWITTANNNSGQTTSNNAQYIGNTSDTTHPGDYGTLYFAERIVQAIRTTVLPVLA